MPYRRRPSGAAAGRVRGLAMVRVRVGKFDLLDQDEAARSAGEVEEENR